MSAGLVLVALAVFAAGCFLVEKRRRRTHPVPSGHQAALVFPHEQEWELYHNALSLCSMKTRVCLSELGILYADRPIDLIETGAYENLRPALLRVNPAGTVPPCWLNRGALAERWRSMLAICSITIARLRGIHTSPMCGLMSGNTCFIQPASSLWRNAMFSSVNAPPLK